MKRSKREESSNEEEEEERQGGDEEEEPSLSTTESDDQDSTLSLGDDNDEENEEDDENEETITNGSTGPPVRDVKTPNWESQETTENENVQQLSNPFDILRMHKRLQLLEIRINNREVKGCIHPAYCSEIENSTPELNETEREINELGNYREYKEKKIVPLFWPKRVYDNESDLLNEEKSNKLKEQISNLHKRKFNFCLRDRTRHTLNLEKEKDRILMPKRKLRLKFSLFDYETDNTDENTDWNDADDL